MKLINNDPLHLVGQRGEQITVEVQSSGTVYSVMFGLNGQHRGLSQGQPLVFTLIEDPTLLHLYFNFSDPQGGVYLIRVAGSEGGDVSEYALRQSPNPGMFATLTYNFELGGDETKGDYE